LLALHTWLRVPGTCIYGADTVTRTTMHVAAGRGAGWTWWRAGTGWEIFLGGNWIL